MSVEASSWAWKQRLKSKPAHRLVLLALADWSDMDHRCFSAYESIANRCGISSKNVNEIISELACSGIVVLEDSPFPPTGVMCPCVRLRVQP